MPYRRLPNTDKARIRAMETAVARMRDADFYAPVISPDILVRCERLLYDFRNANTRYVTNLARQLEFLRSENYQVRYKNARMYVMHFLQVFNMCVLRGEMKSADRSFYSLPVDSEELPDLPNEAAVLRWCENVVRGERERVMRGGIPIYNPTVAKLSVHYDLFSEAHQQNITLRRLTDESLAEVARMRPSVDAVILEMWNSIEHYFADKTGDERLDCCREYGVVYYYRKGEQTD